jgi:hypothetical protein
MLNQVLSEVETLLTEFTLVFLLGVVFLVVPLQRELGWESLLALHNIALKLLLESLRDREVAIRVLV